jgi:ATP-binding cassette, subfamily B, multidrug efflux pump
MTTSSAGRSFDWGIFTRLYQRSAAYRATLLLTGALVLMLALLSPVRPEQMRYIIDDLVPAGDRDGVTRVAMAFVGILLLESVIQYFQSWMANKVAQGITLDLRAELYRHIMRFRLSYFDRTPVGQFVTRHISDIDGIAEVFSVGVLDIARDLLKLIVIVGYMGWVDWRLTLIVLIPIPVLIYATRIFQLAVKKSFNQVRNEVARINVFIQEHVTGMQIIQIFNREKREEEKFEAINLSHRKAHIRSIWAYSVFFPVVELLSAASVSLMLWWGLRGALDGSVTPGLLLEFSMFITMMYRPIRQMADNFNVLQMGVVNAERVFRVLDEKDTQDDTGNLAMAGIAGSIEFRNVWFAYREENWVLKNINLHIPEGSMVAIVGATGAGKSSLAGLLNRFYEINAGQLLIGGNDVRHYPLNELRDYVGVVLQDVFLFSDTVLNNITLNDEAISREEVIQASIKIGTHEFISRLPGAYDYRVGERGAMLSTGQRQLIAFVRAYVRNPGILVLDEATSSVDTESELLIRRATAKLTEGRTSIVIAHRLSTVRQANRIIVMEHGEVAESGTHDELIALNGIYQRLVALQFDQEE